MNNPFESELKDKFEEILTLVKDDLITIKTGRAKPSLVENLKIAGAYEGTTLELRELASISVSDAHQLLIKPWDPNVLEAIQKSISTSDLGLNPIVENDLIRINIPPLTGEGRDELVKLVWQKIESGRILIRQVRGDIKEKITGQKGEAGISEDDIHRWLEELQHSVDEYMKKLEDLGKTKEKELRQI